MKRAIAFSGGGSKGSYQVGVWGALNEFCYEFDIAAGVSIGAINACFYVRQDYDLCKDFWENITADDVMVNGIRLDGKFISLVEEMASVKPFLKGYLTYKGADITPFYENLQKVAVEDRFFESDIDYALITVKFPSLSPVEMTKKDITLGMLANWINASCACFPIFPMAVIDGQSYIDGGYYDKLPIASAFRLGAQEVFAVDLNSEPYHREYLNHPFVRYIYPSQSLGTFMSFEHDVIMRNMNMGYRDTYKFFGKLYGKKYSFRIKENKKVYYSLLAYRFMERLSVTETHACYTGRVINKSAVSAKCTQLLSSRLYYGNTLTDYLAAAFEVCADFLYEDKGEIIDFDDFTEFLLSVVSQSGFRFSSSVEANSQEIKKLVRNSNKNHKREVSPSAEEILIMLCVCTVLYE